MLRSRIPNRPACAVIVGLWVICRCYTHAGSAIGFDGTNDSIRVGTGLFANITNQFTLEFWANPAAARVATAETTNGYPGTAGQRYAIFPDQGQTAYGDGHAGVGLSIGTNGISVFEHSAAYLPAVLVYATGVNGWTHIALVYSNGQPRLYISGNLVRTGLGSGKIVHPSANLGESGSGYGYYQGMLDEVRVWGVALAQPIIQDWKDRELSSAHPAYANLVGYWRLNEGSGTSTADSSIQAHTGTLVNGAAWVTPGAPIAALGDPIVVSDASQISDTSALLNGTVNPQGDETTARFEWGLSTNYGSLTGVQDLGGGISPVVVTQLLSNLQPITTYHYRLWASNSAGVSRSPDRQFTTLGPPSVMTLAASDQDLAAAVLHGEVIANGHATTAWFDWGLTTNYGNATATRTVNGGTVSVSFSETITNLLSGQVYHFSLTATNDSGTAVGLE